MVDTAPAVKSAICDNIQLMIIEMTGTMLLTIAYVQAGGITTAFILSFWALYMFFVKFTGAFFNPAITLAFMLNT
jgi:hypothetical protein